MRERSVCGPGADPVRVAQGTGEPCSRGPQFTADAAGETHHVTNHELLAIRQGNFLHLLAIHGDPWSKQSEDTRRSVAVPL